MYAVCATNQRRRKKTTKIFLIIIFSLVCCVTLQWIARTLYCVSIRRWRLPAQEPCAVMSLGEKRETISNGTRKGHTHRINKYISEYPWADSRRTSTESDEHREHYECINVGVDFFFVVVAVVARFVRVSASHSEDCRCARTYDGAFYIAFNPYYNFYARH